MKISFLVQACFRIETEGKIIITDPPAPMMGMMKLPKGLSADIITISHSHPDHNHPEAILGRPKIFRNAGDYQVDEVKIKGIKTFHDNENGGKRGENIIFAIETEGIRIAHLGDLGHVLSDHQVRELGPIDILLIPVGGFFTIDAKTAVEVINQLKTKIIIPMHYKISKLMPLPIKSVDEFLKAANIPSKSASELIVTADELKSAPKTIVVLKTK